MYIYKFIWVALSILALVVTTKYFLDFDRLANNGNKIELNVVNKSCKSRSGSSVTVAFGNKNFDIQIKRNKCYNLELGDKLLLFHNRGKTKFYLPENRGLYKRKILMAMISLILSLLPWKYLKRKFNNNKYE